MSTRAVAMLLSIGAAIGLMTSKSFAAVLILEGTAAPTSSAPAQPAPSPSAAPPEGTLQAPPPAAAVPAAPTPSLAPPPSALAVPGSSRPASAADLAGSAPPNQAEVSLEMLPGQTVTIGSIVSFKVTSKKAGYVVLMDVDASGHLTQIYPNTALLTHTNRVNGNYVKPGSSLTIPLVTDPYAGVRYVVSPPNGQAMIVCILSPAPVQILDLPDIPAEILGEPKRVLAYLAKQTNELRIPDQDNQLREVKWSFDARPYTIQ